MFFIVGHTERWRPTIQPTDSVLYYLLNSLGTNADAHTHTHSLSSNRAHIRDVRVYVQCQPDSKLSRTSPVIIVVDKNVIYFHTWLRSLCFIIWLFSLLLLLRLWLRPFFFFFFFNSCAAHNSPDTAEYTAHIRQLSARDLTQLINGHKHGCRRRHVYMVYLHTMPAYNMCINLISAKVHCAAASWWRSAEEWMGIGHRAFNTNPLGYLSKTNMTHKMINVNCHIIAR